jgi:hypothetical protein
MIGHATALGRREWFDKWPKGNRADYGHFGELTNAGRFQAAARHFAIAAWWLCSIISFCLVKNQKLRRLGKRDMMEPDFLNSAQAAIWQTGTAMVQAVVSVALLGWYVLAAHLDRARIRREKFEDFDALVRLCRDLGSEAGEKTRSHRANLSKTPPDVSTELVYVTKKLEAWQRDMMVAYVCLNEVPHYEVRNPEFSTALTRLWLAVDSRSEPANQLNDVASLSVFLQERLNQICIEVDSMAGLLNKTSKTMAGSASVLGPRGGRSGYRYDSSGFVQKN